MTTFQLAGAASPDRAQGSGPIGITVTGTGFYPGITIREINDLADVTVTDIAWPNENTLTATINVGENAPITENFLEVSNTDTDNARVLDIDVVAGPKITSFTPSSIGRGATNKTIDVAGSNFVPGSTTFSAPAGSGITVVSQTVPTAGTATLTLNVAADATPGAVSITALEPTTTGRGSAPLTINPDMDVASLAPATLREDATNRTITVTGSNFRQGLSVSFSDPTKINFDDAGAALTVVNATTVTFKVDVQPAANEGDVVTVTVNPGDGGPVDSGQLTVVGAPDVDAFSPPSLGRGAVDAPLQIQGTYLDPSATYSFDGSGLTVGPCTGTTTLVTCQTDVAATAALTARTLTITPSGESPTVIATPKLGINEAPTITALDPDEIGQGAFDHAVTVTGTRFVTGATIGLGDGATTDPCLITETGFSCPVDLAQDTAVGPRTATVVNGDFGRPACTGTICQITVTQGPTITSVTPPRMSRGGTGAITIDGTGFDPDAVFTLGSGISFDEPAVNAEGTQFTATARVAGNAPLTSRQAVATNPDGGRFAKPAAFAIVGKPVINEITPARLGQGATDAVITIKGQSLTPDATVGFGPGVTVDSVEAVGENLDTIAVTVDVAGDAPVGARDVSVANPGGSETIAPDSFTVEAAPTITGIIPAEIGRAAVDRAMRITGTGFRTGATVDAGNGLTAEIAGISPKGTWIDLLVDAAPDAGLGERGFSVTNPNGGAPASCTPASSDCIVVNERPSLVSIDPASRGAGAIDSIVTVTGAGLVPGATLDLGDGIAAVNAGDGDEASVEVALTIAHTAALGSRAATIVNGDGGRSTPVADAFDVLAPPDVTGATPPVIEGDDTVTVTGTNFDPDADVDLGPGVSVTDVTVAPDGTSATALVTVAGDAAHGIRDVRVTNPDDGSDACLGCTGVGDPSVAVVSKPVGDGAGGARFDFYDRVRGVNAGNVQLRERDGGTLVPTMRICRNLDGVVQDCETSTDIRSVELVAIDPLVPGQFYRSHVNPSGASTHVRRSDDTVVPTSSQAFRANRYAQETAAAVQHEWQQVRDRRAFGGRFVRENRAGASLRIGFVGDEVSWFAPSGPAYGVAKVLVDGELIDANVDTSRATTSNRRRFTFSGFGPGEHELVIAARGRKGANGKGSFVGLDAIEDENGLRANPGYDGRWAGRDEPGVASGRVGIASLPGARMSMPFRGRLIEVRLVAGPDGGIAEIDVDGRTRRTVNLFAKRKEVVIVKIGRLADAVHEVAVVATGRRSRAAEGRIIRVNRFRVV